MGTRVQSVVDKPFVHQGLQDMLLRPELRGVWHSLERQADKRILKGRHLDEISLRMYTGRVGLIIWFLNNHTQALSTDRKS